MQIIYDSDDFVVLHMNAPPYDKPFINLGHTDDDSAPMRTNEVMVSDPLLHGQLFRHGFEIVDKRSGKEVYLDGSWAEMFQQKLSLWQRTPPSIDEVEKTLESYAALAATPVMVH